MDRQEDRGTTPVVGKTLALGVAVLYIAGMTTVLLGGVVPDYETRTGEEVSERVLATATGEIERAPPSVAGSVETRTTVELPETIANSAYRLVLSNRSNRLILDHPDPEIGAETRLSLPANVTPVNGTAYGGDLVIRVTGPGDERTLHIEGER